MSLFASNTFFKLLKRNNKSATILAVAILILTGIIAYQGSIQRAFIGADTLSLIESGKIQSGQDFKRIISSQMMKNTPFPRAIRFFRPISSFSYSLDYIIWGLNPLGYHMTDVILHIAASLALFFLIRFLSSGDRLLAWVGAALFLLHPRHLSTVPNPELRHDILAALFCYLSLWLYFKYLKTGSGGVKFLVVSVIFFILALSSKEVAGALTFLILFFNLSIKNNNRASGKRRFILKWKTAFLRSFWFFGSAGCFFLYRFIVLKGIGGYGAQDYSLPVSHLLTCPLRFFRLLRFYFRDLCYPQPFLNNWNQAHILLAAAVITLLFGISHIKGGNSRTRTEKIFRRTALPLMGILFLLLCFWPLVKTAVNSYMIRIQRGANILSPLLEKMNLMNSPELNRRAEPALLETLFFLILITLAGQLYYGLKKNRHTSMASQKPILRLAWIWIGSAMIPFSLAPRYSSYYSYQFIGPACTLMAIFLLRGFRGIFHAAAAETAQAKIEISLQSDMKLCQKRFSKLSLYTTISLLLIVSLVVSILFYSPIIRNYPEIKATGRINTLILQEFDKIVPLLPPGSRLYISNFPLEIMAFKTKIPRIEHTGFVDTYSIESWINLIHPNHRHEIMRFNYIPIPEEPVSIQLKEEKREGEKIFFRLKYLYPQAKNHQK